MPTLMDYFDRIYVINLPERKDRRKAIGRELKTIGLGFADPGVELFSAIRCDEACGFPSPAVRSCFQSHLAILREARSKGLDNVLVVEDDLTISPLLSRHLETLLNGVKPESWGMMYLGHIEDLPSLAAPRLVNYSGPISTAHFYAVNGTILDRLIACLEQMQSRMPGDARGGPMHYDGALTTFRLQNPDICTLITQPNLGWQRSSRSNIHPHGYEKVAGLRQAADFARLLRQSFANFGTLDRIRWPSRSKTDEHIKAH